MAGTERGEAPGAGASGLTDALTAALERLRFTDEESDAVINLSASEIGGVVRAIRPVVEKLIDDAWERGDREGQDYQKRARREYGL